MADSFVTLQPGSLFRALGSKVIQAAALLSPSILQESARSYPSQRPCQACGKKMHYVASWTTPATGLYARTCSHCGFCDPRKVRMIRQL
jgi:hypothetical protein